MFRLAIGFTFFIVGISAAHAHHPCAEICPSLSECKDSADWIVEGTIADVVSAGSHRECETSPSGPRCGEVTYPEKLVLSGVEVTKGTINLDKNRMAVMSRKDSCLGGVLLFMNEKPELKNIDNRVRVFGSDSRIPPHISPGYYLIEPLGQKNAP
jgi:hypothetical protein